MINLTPSQNVELTLIQHDANDLIRVLVGQHGHPDAGYLAYTTMPLIGLVTEESFRYLSGVSQHSVLQAPTSELFSRFGRAVTKSRARIKLFDDTEGYADGLVETLALAHAKSVEWFCEPHRGFFRSLIRRFQPDLGVFFVGENLIATSHTALPAIGITLDELKSFSPGDLSALGERNFAFTREVGYYLTQLANFFKLLGKHINLQPEPPLIRDLRLTHNDFVGAKVYRAALESFRPKEDRFVGAIIMALTHINSAVHVLPRLFDLQSNLLLRIQFLTAYHAANTLEASVPQFMATLPQFSEAEQAILRNRQLRNVCAHYGLRRAALPGIGAEDPFGAVIEALTFATRSDITAIVTRWLSDSSTMLTRRLSKSSLAYARALLGSHS